MESSNEFSRFHIPKSSFLHQLDLDYVAILQSIFSNYIIYDVGESETDFAIRKKKLKSNFEVAWPRWQVEFDGSWQDETEDGRMRPKTAG